MKTFFAVAALLASFAANAVPVLWEFDGTADFNITGGIEGTFYVSSFVYDADSNTYSDIDIVGECGFCVDGFTFGGYNTSGSANGLLTEGADGLKVLGLDLSFGSSLTNAGGTVSVTGEIYDESYSQVQYLLPGATITGTAVVPIPAAVWLFGSALAGLGWTRRRQQSKN